MAIPEIPISEKLAAAGGWGLGSCASMRHACREAIEWTTKMLTSGRTRLATLLALLAGIGTLAVGAPAAQASGQVL